MFTYLGVSLLLLKTKKHKRKLLTRGTPARPLSKSAPFRMFNVLFRHFTLWRICLQVCSTRFRCVTFIVRLNCVKTPPGELFDDRLVNTFSTAQERMNKPLILTCNSCTATDEEIRILDCTASLDLAISLC